MLNFLLFGFFIKYYYINVKSLIIRRILEKDVEMYIQVRHIRTGAYNVGQLLSLKTQVKRVNNIVKIITTGRFSSGVIVLY